MTNAQFQTLTVGQTIYMGPFVGKITTIVGSIVTVTWQPSTFNQSYDWTTAVDFTLMATTPTMPGQVATSGTSI